MPYGYYHMSNAITDITEELIQEIARGKRTVYLFLSCLPHEIATKAYSSLYRIWNKEANFPKYFSLYFIEDSNFFYYATGYRMIGVLHIKQLAELQLNFKEHNDSRKKYGIWIAKNQAKNQWIIVTLRRIQWGTRTQVYICLRAQLSKEAFITTLCLFIDISYPGHAYDYSILYEKMTKMETEEEIKDEYSKSTEFMLRFYRRTYRRTILNVLCEMVMEWWNGPRWILELTKRKPIERRSPFVDLGYVLFQELLCPIYQYCTVPNI